MNIGIHFIYSDLCTVTVVNYMCRKQLHQSSMLVFGVLHGSYLIACVVLREAVQNSYI